MMTKRLWSGPCGKVASAGMTRTLRTMLLYPELRGVSWPNNRKSCIAPLPSLRLYPSSCASHDTSRL